MSADEWQSWERLRGAASAARQFFAPTTTYAVWFAISAVAGLAVCWIPLFNVVGYESAALFGAVFGPVAVFLTLHAFRREVLPEPLEVERARHPFADFAAAAVRHLGLLVAPVAALCLNALRVKNCDFGTGGLFWLLIPALSIPLGQAVGWAVAAATPERRWLRNLVAALVVVASGCTFGLHLVLQPPIEGHQLFVGFFSGSIYDEALALPTSLVAYRGLNVAAAVAVVAAIEVVRLRRAGRPVFRVAGLAALGLVVFAVLGAYRKDLGIGIDRVYIQSELGGRLETRHFVIHYPERESFLGQLDRLAEDHEFRYAEMKEFFGTDPAADGKIHSYVYPNRAEKGRLMGARKTLVAKIWLGEIHVLWPEYGHHWLAHELAHVFTAPFGSGPLRLSMQNGVGVNMGLVEGIATAADWPVDDLTPHEAAAALRRLEMAPEIRDIVGASGFWTQSSGRAYTLVGSFIRYLVDEYGIETFKRAYGRGAFERAYDKSVDELVAEWRDHLEGLELSDDAMETARYRYRRPSIFGKVCPRTTAEIRRRAGIAAARGDTGTMRRLYRRLIGFAPDNVDYRIEFAQRLVRAGDLEASLEIVRRLLERDLPPIQRARLLQLRGDVRWRRGRAREAAEAYAQCLKEGVPIDQRRLLRAKTQSLAPERQAVRPLAFDYLLDDKPRAISLYPPMEWVRRRPEDPLAAYLVGRRLWQHREWEHAVRYLRIARGRLSGEALRAETDRMLGRSLYSQEEFASAARVFERLRDSALSRYRVEGEEWLRRIDWRGGRSESGSE